MDKVAQIKTDVLPELFLRPETIGEYGHATGGASINGLSELMERSPVTRLASCIAAIVASMDDASPARIDKKASRLDRFLGRDIEWRLRYETARKTLDELISDAEVSAQGVRDAVASMGVMIKMHKAESDSLHAYIQAGREYLAEHPEAGVAVEGNLMFDNPRERFSRKLANLTTLMSSFELGVTQMRLTMAQAIDMLDRFEETSRVLIPVWRHHTLALNTTKNMSPAMLAEATRAHEALMRSLSKSVEGINQ